jgi:hypothetical protein
MTRNHEGSCLQKVRKHPSNRVVVAVRVKKERGVEETLVVSSRVSYQFPVGIVGRLMLRKRLRIA